MTPAEERAWVQGLGPTPARQRAVIAELLRHAGHDAMSHEDRSICRRQLERLTTTPNSAFRRASPLHLAMARREPEA
jgi:hypothetical protein